MNRIFLILLLLLASKPLRAADITTTTCPGAGCINYQVGGQGSVGIQITGTWSGTITFQGTIDNTTYVNLRVIAVGDTSSTGVTSTTGNGSWQGTVAGLNQVRIVFTNFVSGTASVFVRVTNTAGKFNGGSGGGGSGADPLGSYLVQTAGNAPTNAQVIASLGTGLMFSTTGTGVVTTIAPTDDNVVVGNGTTWQLKAIGDCQDAGGNHLNYTAASNTFSCGTSGGGGGAGTVTHTAGALTATNIVVGNAAADITVSTCTISGGNLSCPGTISGGTGSSTAGNIVLEQGTLPGAFPPNSFTLFAPTSITTSYQWRVPVAFGTGLIQSTGTTPLGVLDYLAPTDDNIAVGNGTTFELKAVPDCVDTGGNHLNYTAASNAFSCGTSGGGAIAPLVIVDANTVDQRNGVNPQTFRVANTYTSSSVNEYLNLTWSSNIGFLSTTTTGGTARDLAVRAAGGNLYLQVSGGASGSSITLSSAGLSIASGSNSISMSRPAVNVSSGTGDAVDIVSTWNPTVTSTLVGQGLLVKPTINYSNGTPGAGHYEGVAIQAIETALPTGTNYLIRASAGAAGTTDKFTVTNTGQLLAVSGLQSTAVAVTSLPTCNAGNEGLHASVNDSNAASYTAGIGAIVANGGTTHVPVYCDGTNWRIG